MASALPQDPDSYIHQPKGRQDSAETTELPKHGNWQAVRKLGSGGQGFVYLAFDTSALTIGHFADPKEWLQELNQEIRWEKGRTSWDELAASFANFIAPEALRFGALKVLRDDEDAKNPESAQRRFIRELETHGILDHPGLLKTLDSGLEDGWLVSEFYAKGSLDKHPLLFKGRALEALHAMRQVVAGVATMHDANPIRVHRDIKPQNLFVVNGDRLVLGDFGIVHVIEEGDVQQTRFSHPFEKVGTIAWMPPWAIPYLLNPKPNFDVFALGKVLWAMVTGDHNLRNIYEEGPLISAVCDGTSESLLIEDIVKKCVVQKEEECGFEDAGELLSAIDNALDTHNRPQHVQAALHAFSRPGPLYLASISASAKKQRPDCQPEDLYWKLDQDARLRIDTFPEQYLFESTEHGRWLVRPPSGKRTFDNTVDIWFPGIPLTDCKYFQLAMKADWQSPFCVYLHFEPGGWWIRFDASLKQPEKPQSPGLEFGVPAGHAAQVAPFEPVYFDISAAWRETWEQEAVSSAWLSGIRFRGDFQLLFARII